MAWIVRYQANLERVLAEPDLAAVFESIHIYDVMANQWCISMSNEATDGANEAEAGLQQPGSGVTLADGDAQGATPAGSTTGGNLSS